MSVFKSLTVQDVILSPFEVNKSLTFIGNALTSSEIGIDRYLGKNITGSFNPLSDPITGYINTSSYQRLIYDSVKHLYYTNFLTSQTGDTASLYTTVYGFDTVGDVRLGDYNNTNYYNYLQSTLTQSRYFPTSSDSVIGIISVPQKLFGNKIKPGSFNFTSDSGSIIDDGEGNLLLNGGNVCGNIIYQHGLVIITSDSTPGGSGYGLSTYGLDVYGGNDTGFISNFISSSNITCSFSSSLVIYETLFKCTIRENEFNYTLNPTVISNQTTGIVYDFMTGSFFAPYITTVGLYNEVGELLAVGKLSQPLPSSRTTDMNIYVKIDK